MQEAVNEQFLGEFPIQTHMDGLRINRLTFDQARKVYDQRPFAKDYYRLAVVIVILLISAILAIDVLNKHSNVNQI